jgi:hypothetical protein
VLGTIFGPERVKVMREWRRKHNEMHDLYSLPSIIRMIKSMRMRFKENVAQMKSGGTYGLLVGKTRWKETTRKTKT